MSKQVVLKIVSAVAGLGCIGVGAWLSAKGSEHAETLLLGGLAMLGGLGTVALPRLTEPAETPPRSRKRRRGGMAPPLPVLLAMGLMAGGCAAAQTAMVAAPKVRDLTCGGARVVARLSDRVCRFSGGPWVVPRSEAERSEDAASRLLSTGGEAPAESSEEPAAGGE